MIATLIGGVMTLLAYLYLRQIVVVMIEEEPPKDGQMTLNGLDRHYRNLTRERMSKSEIGRQMARAAIRERGAILAGMGASFLISFVILGLFAWVLEVWPLVLT